MRYRRLLPSVLAAGALWLTACGDDIATQPTQPLEPGSNPLALAVAGNTWITRANMPTNRVDLAAATVTSAAGQSILYAIGGRVVGVTTGGGALAKVTAYNVATNTWTFRRPLPRPKYRTNGAGVINGKVYLSGGDDGTIGVDFGSRDLDMYDPATNTWTKKRDMPSRTAGGVTGVIKGKLYVVTACDDFYDPGGCPASQALYRYNPVTDRWRALAPPPKELFTSFNGGGVIGGKLYVLGNYGPDGRLAVYDPVTNGWSVKTPLGRARSRSATAVLAGKLYVMGGVRIPVLSSRDTLAVTITYDPATDTWTPRAPMPSARLGVAGSTISFNGEPRIEVVGGSAPGNNVQYIP